MKRFICILLIAMLCLCVTACGESGSDSGATEANQTETQAQTAAPTTADGKFASVADYLSEPSMAALVAEAETSFSNDTISARIYADGDTMVYEFKYLVKLTDDQINQMKGQLEEGLNYDADSFLSDLESLKQHVSVDEPKLFVVYLASDGYEIASKLYT